MPRGGYRPGAGRPKGSEKKGFDGSGGNAEVAFESPLQYMLSVLNDESAEPHRRDRMAIAAAPFVHRKQGEVGKRDAQHSRANALEDSADWGDLLQ